MEPPLREDKSSNLGWPDLALDEPAQSKKPSGSDSGKGSRSSKASRAREHYGIDDPRSIGMLFGASAISLITGFLVAAKAIHVNPAIALAAVYLGVSVGLLVFGLANLLFWSSALGKPREVEKMLQTMPWGGDEAVLDVGCGQGQALMVAAERLSSGSAVGVDVWRKQDLSRNTPAAAKAHAVSQGLMDRTILVKSDARNLPFVDGSFDVVLSSLVLHVFDNEGREQALKEMTRVLKQGGRIAILDTVHADQYSRILAKSGLTDIKISRLRFGLFPPGHSVQARALYRFST